MSFPRYPKYKPSGVEWLGEVPEHWGVVPLKHAARLTMGQSPSSEECNTEGLGVPFLQGCAEFGSISPLPRVFCPVATKYAEHGDILFSVRAPVGKLNVADRRFGIGRGLCAIHPTELVESRFLTFGLQELAKALLSVATGSTYESVSIDQVGGCALLLPPPSEQRAIAAFLDRETAKIDALIAEQEKLIELLAEKRQAVISHAVTKGLDPAAPMKPSGVEWLGDVPAHWDVKLIKRLSPVLRGASPRPIDDPKYFDDEGEYSWVRIADVSASNGELLSTQQRLSNLGSSLSVKLEPGSLFVSIAGTVGKPCISRIKACIHDGFVYFPRLAIEADWLYRIFAAGLCYGGLGKLGTQLNLNTDTIGGIHVPLPPAAERRAIAAFVDAETTKMELFVTEAEKGIELLRERRSALISAAVTGQIDVRNTSPELVA